MTADLVTDPAQGFQPLAAAAVDAVIGTASGAIAVNETRLFVLNVGENSAVFLFQSNDGNSAVAMDELFLLAVVAGQSVLTAGDLSLLVV